MPNNRYRFIICLSVATLSFLAGCAGSHSVSAWESIPKIIRTSKSDEVKVRGLFAYLQAQQYALKEKSPKKVLLLLEEAKNAYPHSAPIYYEQAVQFTRERRWSRALASLDAAIKKNPDYYPAHLLQARVFLFQGNVDQSIKKFEELLKVHPDEEELYSSLSRIFLQQNENVKAEKTLLLLLKRDPNSLTALYYLGVIYGAEENRLNDSAGMFKRLLVLQPSNRQAWKGLAQLYLDNKKNQEALKVFKEMERSGLADVSVQLRIAILHYEMGDFKSAIDRLEAVRNDYPQEDKLNYYLAVIYEESGNPEKAMKIFNDIPTSSNYFKDANLRRAVYHLRNREVQNAINVLEETIAHKNDVREFYEYLAFLYQENNQDAKAAQTLRRAILYTKTDAQLYFSLGIVYERMNLRYKAVEAMREVIKRDSSNVGALNYIGYMYADWGVRLESAERMLRKAVSLRPRDGHILDSLAWVYFKKSEYEQALKLLNQADIYTPNEPAILRHKAETLYKLGRNEDSKIILDKAIKALKSKPEQDEEELDAIKQLQKALSI